MVWPEITLHIRGLLEILNKCIVFLSEKIYMNTFIYEAYECSTSKSAIQECVLYK